MLNGNFSAVLLEISSNFHNARPNAYTRSSFCKNTFRFFYLILAKQGQRKIKIFFIKNTFTKLNFLRTENSYLTGWVNRCKQVSGKFDSKFRMTSSGYYYSNTINKCFFFNFDIKCRSYKNTYNGSRSTYSILGTNGFTIAAT